MVARAMSVALLAFVATSASALAAPQTVNVGNNFFSPEAVTVNPGESVTWSSTESGSHSITSEAGQPAAFESDPGQAFPSRPAGSSFAHTFDVAGTTSYFCRVHPGSMRGRVIVAAPGTPADAPVLTGVRADPATFCNDRSEECEERGTRIRFSLSKDAVVRIKVRRKGSDKTLKSFKVAGKAGKNKARFAGKGLEPGDYEAKLTATDAAGLAGKTKTARLSVEE